ncbi:cholesterol 7-alpha-monooxygenase [Podospora conica]|nr:cholesterol 7-alpha-monooxygenase [Schizothecium conicum]
MTTLSLHQAWTTLRSSPWHIQYATIAALLLLPFLLTYVLTSLRASFGRRIAARPGPGPKEAPVAPYAVPLLAHTFQFAVRTEKFLWHMLSLFPATPFRLFVGPQKFTFIPHGDLVLALFRSSRDLTAKPLTITSLRDLFAMRPADLTVFLRDDSGIHAKPLPGFESFPPAHRVFFAQHRDLHNLLTGTALDVMTSRFITLYSSHLHSTPSLPRTTDWTPLPDLYAFLRTSMFTAATTALCGPHLLRLAPTLPADFWAYDRDLMLFLRRTPRLLAPRAHATRDRVLAAFAAWHAHAAAHFPASDLASPLPEWEPLWGARLNRARALMFSGAGLSAHGRASQDLGMLWATNANVVPSTMWALLEIYRTPGLEGRVRAEVDGCWDEGRGEFDVPALCGRPLLTSIYHEALRYSVGVTPARDILVEEVEVGGWRFRRGETLMCNTWFGGRDEGFWNVGRVVGGRAEHPVDEFWAERFLEYPDDPASGPVRKKDESVYRGAGGKAKTVEDDRTAKVVTAGTAGHFFPYGGGTKICPGRFFAKQEMVAAIAVLMREFEVELLDVEGSRKTRPDMKYFPAGSLPPDRAVPVRMRRRR